MELQKIIAVLLISIFTGTFGFLILKNTLKKSSAEQLILNSQQRELPKHYNKLLTIILGLLFTAVSLFSLIQLLMKI